MIDREIKYNRETKDFDCFVDGRYVGSRPNYRAGDELCNEIAYDLCERGLVDTLPVCVTCGGDGDCPDCDRYGARMPLLTVAPESLRQDCLNVITMALGQTSGATSVVAELRRVRARLEAAAADREPSPEEVAAHMASVYIPNWQPAVAADADLP